MEGAGVREAYPRSQSWVSKADTTVPQFNMAIMTYPSSDVYVCNASFSLTSCIMAEFMRPFPWQQDGNCFCFFLLFAEVLVL